MFLKSDFNICNNNNTSDLRETFTFHIFAATLTNTDNTKNLFKMLKFHQKSTDECKEQLTVPITPVCIFMKVQGVARAVSQECSIEFKLENSPVVPTTLRALHIANFKITSGLVFLNFRILDSFSLMLTQIAHCKKCLLEITHWTAQILLVTQQCQP